MSSLEQVKKSLEQLRLEEMRLEAKNFEERIAPEVAGLVGATYVYRGNSYGHGERWNTFRIVRNFGFSEYNAWVIGEECQLDSEGVPSVRLTADLICRDSKSGAPWADRGWKRCSREEYDAARQSVLNELESGDALKKKLIR